MRKSLAVMFAISAATAVVPAFAQNDTTTADPAATYPAPAQDDDDDSGKWGWLGLLGLAGLVGLKRRDHDHHVHHTDTTSGTTTRR